MLAIRPFSAFLISTATVAALATQPTLADDWIELDREIAVRDGKLQSVEFSPDNKIVAACGDKYVQAYSVKTGELILQLEGHTRDIFHFAFSPNRKWIAACSRDRTVRVWDAKTGESIAVLVGHTDLIGAVSFSSDSRWLASVGASQDSTVRIWNCGTWKEQTQAMERGGSHSMFVAFSPDGSSVATSGYRVHVHVYGFDGHKLEQKLHVGHVGGEMTPHITFSPDGSTVVSSGWDRTLRNWDAGTGDLLWKADTPPYARCFEGSVFSTNGKILYTVTRDETIQRRDAKTGKLLNSFRWNDEIRAIDLTSDGRKLATAGHYGKIRVWSIK